MSTLRENQCYGLSSGKLNRGNVSVFHVKLTDSAARAIGAFQKCWSLNPTISFNGNQGRITIPYSKNRDEVRIFTFGVTNVACDNPHGSFDCVQQLSTGSSEELSCLGVIQKKMTVNATDDSYDKARQSMAQAEEETRSRGAIVIKHGGCYQGKKVTVRAPTPGRPLRERVTHLLALRPYKRPELILRLQKDGLSADNKDTLDSVLMEVGQLNSRDNTFVLKDALYKELQKDWPGYTPGDQQLLKRILVRRLFQPHQTLLTVPEAQVSPLRDTPNSSPAHRSKHSLVEEYPDPLTSKKPRISHLSSKTASDKSRLRPSEQLALKDVTEGTVDDRPKNSLDPRRLFDSLSVVCQQEEEMAKRLHLTPAAQEERENPENNPQPDSDHRLSSLVVPDLNRHTIKRKKSKHKDQVMTTSMKVYDRPRVPSEILFDSNVTQPDSNTADYLSKYTAIYSHDQRLHYKQDFNNEYKEYRDLHARIDSVTRQFMELDTQLKQLHHESHKYKTVHNQILQEYRKIKKSNPNYNQDKIRCEYLHNKLAHIKKLISQYDQQQLTMARSSPK
uniref:RNA polymerase II elongation factor ELL-like n=1 Tax=Mastacembelus armatus TaxID=205130 RepID=A0A7N8YCF1_9TELE